MRQSIEQIVSVETKFDVRIETTLFHGALVENNKSRLPHTRLSADSGCLVQATEFQRRGSCPRHTLDQQSVFLHQLGGPFASGLLKLKDYATLLAPTFSEDLQVSRIPIKLSLHPSP